MSSLQGASSKRSSGGLVDYADRQPRNSNPGFTAQVGNLRISVPSLRRSARLRMPGLVLRWFVWTAGVVLLAWGLYGAGLTLVHRGGGQEILNGLLAVFGGSLLVFLAGHDQAVQQRRLEQQQKSDDASGRSAAW